MDEAIASLRRAVDLSPENQQIHSNLLLILNYHPDYDRAGLFKEARLWAKKFGPPLIPPSGSFLNDPAPDRCLRVGYVSSDFRAHAAAFFLTPLFKSHDPREVEIFCYSHSNKKDVVTQKLMEHVRGWRDIAAISDARAAEIIREDRIDILVDLNLHSNGGRLTLFARKPAPVQVAWLAYPGTSGLSTIDYRFTDSWLDPLPDEQDAFYSEKSLRLPDSFWCYEQFHTAQPAGVAPALQTGQITFGSLNNFCQRFSPAALRAWGKLLLAVPNSRLILHAHPGRHRERAAALLVELGVARERLEFVGHLSTEKYLQMYHQLDIVLDTFPWAGGTTTCDALWMGVPVVTLAGKTSVGRGGVSILSTLGLPELVARRSEDDYIQIAARLRQQPVSSQ